MSLLYRAKSKYLLWLTCLAVLLCGLICCRVSEEPALVEIPKAESSDPNVVRAVCGLIYEGHFEAAGELIEQTGAKRGSQLGQLAKVVGEYEDIGRLRQIAREAAYNEQLAELDKFRGAVSAMEGDREPRADADTNDVNDIVKVLSVIAKAGQFADEAQKEQLLSDRFVKHIFQTAKDKAGELESKGQWFDAYVTCYSWLQAIDKKNEEYSHHAEELLDKAGIVASFQDSPCETSKERYEGVDKQLFIRAINVLNFNYVSVIDYREMAAKATRRCELLTEVLQSSFSQISRGLEAHKDASEASEGAGAGVESGPEEDLGVFAAYDSKKLAAWSATLAAISDEVDRSPTGVSKGRFIDVFESILALNSATVEIPSEVLIAQFVEAALSALDPYTILVWPRQVQDFEKTMTNEFTGIGIEISKRKGLLTVVSLLPDTPAYYSGLDAGDVIEKVDGVETKDMSLICAVKNITGPAGTEVTLTLKRPPEELSFDITITRDKITVPTIRGWKRTEAGKWLYMIDQPNKIGYVRITSFSERTGPDLERALNKLEQEGLRGLILDLRSNPGGLLDSAVEVADKFISRGLIVSTRPRSWAAATYKSARRNKTRPNYPLVILIDRYSASASEIVAGALADEEHKRAILVGERTHGKGVVQGIAHYPKEGAQLKYTMAYYHLPSGQRVKSQDAMKKLGREDWGVGPNIEVKLRNDELRKMFDVQRDNDVLVKADHDEGSAPLEKHTIGETLAVDSQLAVGILVVKSKLIEAGSVVLSSD